MSNILDFTSVLEEMDRPKANNTEPAAKPRCNDKDVVRMLSDLFLSNSSSGYWEQRLQNQSRDCKNSTGGPLTLAGNSVIDLHPQHDLRIHDIGKDIYAYMTPVIIVIGLVGNGISLKVFTSKVMQRLPSSLYLVALSASDILVLLTYVFIDWLNHGMLRWPGKRRLPLMNVNGACQAFLYASYTFRFISAWLIVIFAVERFIAVCMPVYRKRFVTNGCAKRLILAVVLFACLLCLYKPILSEVHETPTSARQEKACTRNRAFTRENFILDAVYGVMITAVPSLVILALNVPILKRLVNWDSGAGRGAKIMHREKQIRLEFTVILFAISSCFICLNLPYFIIWCQQFHQSLNPQTPTVADRLSGQLYITRTIFYVNYCANFFLYILTGAYYRREIRSMFRYYFRMNQSPTNHPGGVGGGTALEVATATSPSTSTTKCMCTFL